MPKYKILDREGAPVVEQSFDAMLGTVRGPIAVKRGKKWGYIARDGTSAVELIYDEARPFAGELGPVRKGKKWGFVDARGTMVIGLQFDSANPFIGGLAAVAKGGKWGFVDPQGELRVEPRYDGVTYFGDQRAGINVGGKTFNDIVTIGGKWGIVDATGTVVLKPKYDTFMGFRCGVVPVSKSGKNAYHAYVGIDGKERWKAPAGIALGSFSEDRAWGARQPQPAKYQLLSRTFEWLTEPRYEQAEQFSEGLCAVNVGGTFKDGEVIGGRWGFCDDRGEIVIEPRFSLATGYEHGLAPVKLAGRWGVIDREGELVVETKYRDAFVLSPERIMVCG